MKCHGRNFVNHCCYIAGKPCPFLERSSEPGQMWSCQLRRENGSWDKAIEDRRYNTGAGSPGYEFAKYEYKNCKDFQCAECEKIDARQLTLLEATKARGGGWVQTRRCDGSCCNESPRFPNEDRTDCIYHVKLSGKESSGCKLMLDPKIVPVDGIKSYAFPELDANVVFQETCVDWPHNIKSPRRDEVGDCCWQWVDG